MKVSQILAVAGLSLLLAVPAYSAEDDAPTAESKPASPPPGTALNRVVAVINNSVLTDIELQREVAKVELQLRQQRLQAPPAPVLREQVLNRAVLQRLQLERAEGRRIRIDDETLNRTIEGIAQRNNMDIAAFRELLERDGYVFSVYREDVRNEMILSRLRQQEVAGRITVSEQEVDNYLANEALRGSGDNEFKLSHILISIPEAASPEQVETARKRAEDILARLKAGGDFAATAIAESDGQNALEGGSLGWRKAGELPTLFADRIVGLQTGEVSNLLRSASGFHILRLEDKRRADATQGLTQYHARHILIRPLDEPGNEEARQKVLNLRDRLRSGADFAELAKVHSEDTVSATNGGDLGWMSADQLTSPFPEVLDSLQPGELSEPVQTRFGWHLIELLERRQVENTDDSRRNRARMLVQQRKVQEAEEDWLRRLRDEAFVEYRL